MAERGFWLTAWIILASIGAIVSPLFFFLSLTYLGPFVQQLYTGVPLWVYWLSGILALVGLVFIVGIIKWKKWGVYGYIVLAIIPILIGSFYFGLMSALSGVIGLIIFILIVRRKWQYFE